MRERALIHVAGPAGAGKTVFVETLIADLGDRGAFVLAARCVRDGRLHAPRETAPKTHPELRRYLAAGATGAALFAFPEEDDASDAFFMTRLMEDYSEAVVLEGDNPVAFVDLAVFVAPAPAPGRTLFVRRKRDRAKEERAKAEVLERLLREPGGVAEFLGQMIGGPVADLAREKPVLFEEARASLLAGIARVRKAPPPGPTEHWALAERYEGLERAQLVVVNIRTEAERSRAEELAADARRLRKEPAFFWDILRGRGTRVPVTAIVANLADPKDRDRKKAMARVRRAISSRS
jgi:hypothetical protein